MVESKTTEQLLELLKSVEDYLSAEQAFANDGVPENFGAFNNAEAQLKGIIRDTKKVLNHVK